MSNVLQTGVTVLPGEGKPLSMVQETVYIRLKGEDTGGAYSVIEDRTPPQAGPPMHVHSREDETFYVVEGEFDFRLGDETIRATPGTYVFGPRGVPHTFTNIGEKEGTLLIVFSPPGFENFFEEVDAAGRNRPPAFESIVELAAKYGNRLG